MILHKVIPVFIIFPFLSGSALAQQELSNLLPAEFPSTLQHVQDYNDTVVPVAGVKLLGPYVEGKFGTGFCLDPACRFIGTNYHVAVMAQPRKIRGQKIIQRYLATGPDDEGATVNDGLSVAPMKYNLSRDLAIFELRHPLPHCHGIAFSLDDLQVGQEVDIYAYPKEGINPFGNLLQFRGRFKGQTTTGLLAFDYRLSAGKAIRPGASGGIVVDSKTQEIVGILNAIGRNVEAIALAVPVQSLADFVSKVQPCLAQNIFPSTKGISPVSPDLYPKFVPSPDEILQRRPEEPTEAKMLRSKAQLLADSMRDFIAVQTFAWGSGDNKPVAEAAYEIRVVDGNQRFRKYPEGKKESAEGPFPNVSSHEVSVGGQWSELPRMVGTQLRLKIHQAEDVVVNERRMKVFQYRADPEDGVCQFESIFDFELFVIKKIATIGCYGEVWMDEEGNILRMSEHLENVGWWNHYQTVVTYGWLRRKDEAARLIPLTIAVQAQHNKRVYWCRGRFMNYRAFSSQVKAYGINQPPISEVVP